MLAQGVTHWAIGIAGAASIARARKRVVRFIKEASRQIGMFLDVTTAKQPLFLEQPHTYPDVQLTEHPVPLKNLTYYWIGSMSGIAQCR
jgi:hypothetical protein